jgi:hypothetical protein
VPVVPFAADAALVPGNCSLGIRTNLNWGVATASYQVIPGTKYQCSLPAGLTSSLLKVLDTQAVTSSCLRAGRVCLVGCTAGATAAAAAAAKSIYLWDTLSQQGAGQFRLAAASWWSACAHVGREG